MDKAASLAMLLVGTCPDGNPLGMCDWNWCGVFGRQGLLGACGTKAPLRVAFSPNDFDVEVVKGNVSVSRRLN